MTPRLSPLLAAALIAVSSHTAAQATPDPASPVLEAMKVELARALAALRSSPTPPYFLGYDITEQREVSITASFGAITDRSDERRRALDVQLRVGSYTFDNTHAVRGEFPDFRMFFNAPVDIPIDNDPMAIRAALWYETQQRYRDAVEALSHARTNAGLRVAPEDSSPDFSRESPERHIEAPESLVVDRAVWEAKLRRYTARFLQQRDIYGANAYFQAIVETHWYVNSEGTTIQTFQAGYRLSIVAFSKAEDGMELPRYESFFAATPAGLPDDSMVQRAADRMIADLQALRRAPAIDPYTGPAILSGRASAVFFHEILGHRLEGHRQKSEDEGQTFTRRVTEVVLPSGFSVYFDPTLRKLGNTDLAGHYRYDDEGVPARRVGVIERGVLKTFLMSRMPIEGFANSNGHGRRQVGFSPVARQSNLIVQVAAPRTRAQLKQQLIDQIRRQRKPYGLFFDDIEGGFTITQRGIPNAFEVLPVMVYRVFPDGREELVRGVDLIGTPLTVFSQITAGDDQVAVFNGMCGAESGFVPVSAVSPGILISQIEVQKKPKSSERPPILPPPPLTPGPGADTSNVVLRAMRDELARSMADLHLDTMPRPYFLSYRIDDITRLNASASRGSLISSAEARNRRLTVELRIGDYTFDNTNFLGMPDMSGFIGQLGGGELPLDDDYSALRRELWLATDGSYKSAVADIAQKRAVLANRTRRTDLPDFSREDPVTSTDTAPVPRLDRSAVEGVVRSASAVFQKVADVYQSEVSWSGGYVRTWYVNSEGTSYSRLVPWGSVRASASTQATDGLPLEDGVSDHRATPDDLPGREALTQKVQDFATRLAKLRDTPPAATYNGPVLFEGVAAVELFASAMGSQFLADRAPVSDNAMFTRMRGRSDGLIDQIGSRVLPRSFTVVENPTARQFEGRSIGGALIDDEGVRTRETRLVERGVLKTLLTTRVPVTGIPRSTGSCRGGGPGITNLFVTSDSGLTDAQLRKRALAIAAEQGNNGYAIVIRRIGRGGTGPRGFGGFMTAMRASGMAGAIPVADAVKLYPDGHEEPIRGAMLAGVSEASFKDIAAASRSRTALALPAGGSISGMLMMLGSMRRGSFAGSLGQTATYVVPSLLFEELSIRKPTGDGIAPPAFSPPWMETSRE